VSFSDSRPARPASPGGSNDLAFTLLVSATATVMSLSLLLWTAGQLSGALTGHGWPASTPGQAPNIAVDAVAHHAGDPAAAWPAAARDAVAGPGWVWALTLVLLAAAAAAGYAAFTAWRRVTAGRGRGRRPGMASGSDVARHLSARAVQQRSAAVRPSLTGVKRPAPHLVALCLGRDGLTRQAVWGSVEDSYLVLGPPRAGKGVHLVIPLTLDAPGAAIVTSTRPDVLRATWARRCKHGPAVLFDPQDLSGQGNTLRWSPVRGCAEPLTAILRARALVAGGAKLDGGTVTNGDFWHSTAEAVVRCYLHAAALGDRGIADVLRWVGTPTDNTPVDLLRRSPGAAAGWAAELAAQVDADSRHRDNVWAGVRRSFDCLADPRVLAACSPGPGEDFDPDAFLDDDGTLYLLGSAAAQLSVAPLITALVEDVVEAARRRAARAPGGRLDPPLTLMLDEAANIAPLPSLPSLLSDGGGTGLTTLAVLQSLAQARARWGEEQARSMWDAATVKIVLGGLADIDDLEDISRLAGEYDETTTTRTSSMTGGSRSTSFRRARVLPVEELRTLPFGWALLLHRTLRPVRLQMTPWWKRPDAKQVTAAIATAESEQGLHAAAS